MSTISPDDLFRMARHRYLAATGQQWRHASLTQRRAWWRHSEPPLRAEHGIDPDAVWRNGTWQPGGQLVLFATENNGTDTASEDDGGSAAGGE